MAERVTFLSVKSHLCINRGSFLIQVPGPGGVPAYREQNQSPIEFENNKYTTEDEEEIEFLRNHPGYNPDGLEGNAMFTEDTPTSALREAETGSSETTESEPDKESSKQEDAPPEDSYSAISGVSNKAEAVKALESTGLDVTVTASDEKDDIIAFAHEHGYRFEGYE